MKTQILIASMLLGTAVSAEDHMHTAHEHMMRSGSITDADIYTAAVTDDFKWDAEIEFNNIDPEWNRIGEIDEIVLDADGKMVGVIAEIGGFLGMGDKDVMLSLDEVSMFTVTNDDGETEDYVFVTGLTKDQLTDRQDVDDMMAAE